MVLRAPRAPAKSFRPRGAKNLCQSLDATHQGAFKEFLLCPYESVLKQTGGNRFHQDLFIARLGKKAEYVSLVDCVHSRVQVRVASQEYSYGVGRFLANLSQELGAVHSRHPHI